MLAFKFVWNASYFYFRYLVNTKYDQIEVHKKTLQ